MSAPIEGWKGASVRELCKIGRGRVISAQDIDRRTGIYPVFSSQSSNKGEMGAIDTFDFDGEYVTWTTDGAYAGTVFYRTGRFNCTNVCGTLAAKDSDLCMAFLAYKLSTIAKDHVSYVGNPKLMNGVMGDITFPLPESKAEQTKIAEILSTVDRAIEQTEALIAKQERIKTGLMQDLLTRGIDENGNLRSEATHEFKDSPLGRIPAEWEVSTLGRFAEFFSGYAFKNQELSEHGWRVVRISNLHKSDFPYWHYDGPIKKRWMVRSGDILFSWAGVASSIDCVRYTGEDALLNQHIYNFKFETEELKDYVFYFLQNYLPKLRTEIEGGAGQLHLTKAKIQSITIPALDASELTRIVKILESLEESNAIHERQLSKIKGIKTALMQDLLTGRKRVSGLLSA